MKQMRRAGESAGYPAGNFGLTISAADLSWNGNDDTILKGITITKRTPTCCRAARTPLGAKDMQAQ